MHSYEKRIQQAENALKQAEYILIGGGAGLSDAAGLKYSGSRFADNFASFIDKYNFKDLYTSSFYSFETEEERWAYWAKHISINRYETPAANLYKDLFRLVQDKQYFVLTTNVDYQFFKADFPEKRIFAVQGDYGYFQCARACHDTLYYNESQVAEMIQHISDCKIPTELVPECPVCGGKIEVNVHKDKFFVRDKDWYESENRYMDFVDLCRDKRVVYMELGVGFNTPGIIRFPFERLTYANENATLIRVNRDHPQGVEENIRSTIAFTEDMGQLIEVLKL